jgi:hypothetical protein
MLALMLQQVLQLHVLLRLELLQQLLPLLLLHLLLLLQELFVCVQSLSLSYNAPTDNYNIEIFTNAILRSMRLFQPRASARQHRPRRMQPHSHMVTRRGKEAYETPECHCSPL